MDLLIAARDHVLALSDVAKLTMLAAVMVGVPPLARRIGVAGMVGLALIGGVLWILADGRSCSSAPRRGEWTAAQSPGVELHPGRHVAYRPGTGE